MAEVQEPREQIEEKTNQKSSERVTATSVISTDANQEVHSQVSAVTHANDRTLSEPEMIAIGENETPEAYRSRVAQIQANRCQLFDSAAESKPVLIAQASGIESNPLNDLQKQSRDLSGDIVNGIWNTTVGTAEAINRHFNTVHIPQGATMDYLSGIIKNPEKYEQYFQEFGLNVSACDAASKAFVLDRLGIEKNLVAGLVWNEQLHKKPTDLAQDSAIWAGVKLDGGTSIGPAQMQIRNIEFLAEKYPGLKELGDPLKAALDPAKAPFFVAAYLANEVESISAYNKEHSTYAGFVPVVTSTETLAYRYNPDVYRDQGEFRSLEPWEKIAVKLDALKGVTKQEWPVAGVPEHSHHVRKVREAMKEVEANR